MQICLGEYETHFNFHPDSTISVEGHWELRDPAGALIDQAIDPTAEREAYRVHLVLGKMVESYYIDAPRSFSLRFDSGHVLTIFDNSTQSESFSIQPGNIFI